MNDNTLTTLTNNQPLLLCCKCMKTIPSISFAKVDNNMEVQIKCSKCNCNTHKSIADYLTILHQPHQQQLPSESHQCANHNSKANTKSYCITCSNWYCNQCILQQHNNGNHCVSFNEVSIPTCINHHKRPLRYHCNDCNVSICSICYENTHINHKVDSYETLMKTLISSPEYTNFSASTQEILNHNVLRRKIAINYINKKINKLIQLRNAIESSYNHNREINEQISQLYNIIESNMNFFNSKQLISYQLITSLKNVQVNKASLPSVINDNDEQYFNKLIQFYKTNFIVSSSTNYKQTPQCISQIKRTNIKSITKLLDGRLAIVLDKSMQVLSRKHFNVEYNHPGKYKNVLQLKDGRLLINSYNALDFINTADWTLIHRINQSNYAKPMITIELSHNRILNNNFSLYDISTYTFLYSFDDLSDCSMSGLYRSSIMKLNDGRVLANYGNFFRIWNVESRTFTQFELEGMNIDAIQLADDRLLCALYGGDIVVYNVYTLNILERIEQKGFNVAIQLEEGDVIGFINMHRMFIMNTKPFQIVKEHNEDFDYKAIQGYNEYARRPLNIFLLDDNTFAVSNRYEIRIWSY